MLYPKLEFSTAVAGVTTVLSVKGLFFSNTVQRPLLLLSTQILIPGCSCCAYDKLAMSLGCATRNDCNVNPTPNPV